MKFNENYERLAGRIIKYVHELVNRSLIQRREIIIWGYGRGGKWFRHLINDYDGRVEVAYIIDDKVPISYDSFPVIYRHTLLNYLNPNECLILSFVKDYQEILSCVLPYGYETGRNIIDVRAEIGNSYIEFLEKKNERIDFGYLFENECKEYMLEDCNEHIPMYYASADMIFNEISSLDENLAFFDFGCGKGASLVMAYLCGVQKLGGIELVTQVYEQAKLNMRELDIECELINGDATTCSIDEYNCFFFYNPFTGKIFEKVMNNIEDSYKKKPRKLYLIYGNPLEHKQVIKNGYFRLIKQIRVDLWDPLLNIYSIECK